jgi:hypothetical protein
MMELPGWALECDSDYAEIIILDEGSGESLEISEID